MQYYNKRLKIAIDEETLKELKQIAKAKRMKVSELVRLLIYAELNRYRKLNKSNPL